MPLRPSKRGLKELPKQEVTWHLAIHQLRVWIDSEETDEPVRPWAMLLLNASNGMIQHSTLTLSYPEPAEVSEFLAESMRRRDAKMGVKPGRPTLILLEDEALVKALHWQLANIGVRVEHVERPKELNALFVDLEQSISGGEQPAGLLAMRGVKPEMVASLFAAAAEFYRAAVWEKFSDEEVLGVEMVGQQRERFVVIMGGGGIEYGLAFYNDWADIERLFTPMADALGDVMDRVPSGGAHALYFNDITETPFDDIDAIEQYGWEVVDEDAYPVPMIFARSGKVRRPQRPELQWYEALLRALLIFVRDHWRRDEAHEAKAVEAVIPVTTSAGAVQVRIVYPAGELPDRADRPHDALAWLANETDDEDDEFGGLEIPDRRAMESVFGDLLGAAASDVDDEVAQAQQIMYEAWEERKPARRIELARQALATSPDCADAYVLLAEEATKTAKEALAFYEQGVAAGERALGDAFFRDNVGYFWGLLETRPYMRARQGLAEVLWGLGRQQEAADHFSELLRLNPGDNQGIRYMLLNVLMDLNRDADARKLIKQYPDDGMAAWLYTNALLLFRQHGAGRQANAALKAALAGNPHVPAYLGGKKRLPARLPEYMGFGDQNEAIHYVTSFRDHWRQTPGAIEWLNAATK